MKAWENSRWPSKALENDSVVIDGNQIIAIWDDMINISAKRQLI